MAYILPRDPVSHPTALIMLTFYENDHAADGSGWSTLEQELPVEQWVSIIAYRDQVQGVDWSGEAAFLCECNSVHRIAR